MSIRSSNSTASTQVSPICTITLHQFSSITTWHFRACGNALVISSAPEQWLTWNIEQPLQTAKFHQ